MISVFYNGKSLLLQRPNINPLADLKSLLNSNSIFVAIQKGNLELIKYYFTMPRNIIDVEKVLNSAVNEGQEYIFNYAIKYYKGNDVEYIYAHDLPFLKRIIKNNNISLHVQTAYIHREETHLNLHVVNYFYVLGKNFSPREYENMLYIDYVRHVKYLDNFITYDVNDRIIRKLVRLGNKNVVSYLSNNRHKESKRFYSSFILKNCLKSL